MEIVIDKNTIGEAGFNVYLNRELFATTDSNISITAGGGSYTDASSLVGGIIGAEGIIYLGSKQVRLDGKNKRIVINDGTTDRVIIGYLG
jgi:hypothetical protein